MPATLNLVQLLKFDALISTNGASFGKLT